MRVGVYAVEAEGRWALRLSLCPAVDWIWWGGMGGSGWNNIKAERIIMLSSAMPLGWALKLRERIRCGSAMGKWTAAEWRGCMIENLKDEIREEEIARGQGREEWLGELFDLRDMAVGREVNGIYETAELHKGNNSFESGWSDAGRHSLKSKEDLRFDAPDYIKDVSRSAELLITLLVGRSLLQAEVEALLAEQASGVERPWKAAVQLAYLQGRLMLEAAVGSGRRKRTSNNASGESEGSLRAEGDLNGGGWNKYGAGSDSSRSGRARRGNDEGSVGINWSKVEAERDSYVRSSGSQGLYGGTGSSIRWSAVRAALRLPQLLLRGAARRRAEVRCLRCCSAPTGRTPCAACGLACCAYCEACLALGRSRACALLLRSAASPAVRCTAAGTSPTVAARRWGLSAAQAGAAGAALGFLAARLGCAAGQSPERFLLWAVTGAGKTEITFPLLDAVLAAGGRALVATPRRDVVLELAPRLVRAFPAETLAVLYGGSPDRWIPGQITVATTHQLLRFYQAFDLVIIDELDAFPYHNDPMLAFAAGQACKPDGVFIFLSATPPQNLQRQVSLGRLQHARVPVRFHGHPLPVPQRLTMSPVQQCIRKGGLHRTFIQALHKSLLREAQVFLFVSRIAHIEPILVLLRRIFPEASIEGTSSQDPLRSAKVMSFREREIRILVTTTILERGVTVPRSDVFILDADSSLFDEASLVQMAGRAGRSKEDPAGSVIFLSPQWTSSQRKAIAQIRTMNTIARRQGYLKGGKRP